MRKKGQAKTPESEGLFPKTPPVRSGKKRFQQSKPLASGGEKSIGWKAASEEGPPSKSTPGREVESWLHNSYFDFVYEAPANTRPKGLIEQFQASIVAVLDLIYNEDCAVCLL